MKVLKDAIFQLSPKLELKKLDQLKERIVDMFKTYEEPEFDSDGKFIPKKVRKAPVITDAQKQDGDFDVQNNDE